MAGTALIPWPAQSTINSWDPTLEVLKNEIKSATCEVRPIEVAQSRRGLSAEIFFSFFQVASSIRNV